MLILSLSFHCKIDLGDYLGSSQPRPRTVGSEFCAESSRFYQSDHSPNIVLKCLGVRFHMSECTVYLCVWSCECNVCPVNKSNPCPSWSLVTKYYAVPNLCWTQSLWELVFLFSSLLSQHEPPFSGSDTKARKRKWNIPSSQEPWASVPGANLLGLEYLFSQHESQ